MDGKGEHRRIATKDCRRSIAMMHVRVHDHGFFDGTPRLQFANGHGYVVNRAESFPVVGIRMMKTAAEIRSEPVSQRRSRRESRPARRQPDGFYQFRSEEHTSELQSR